MIRQITIPWLPSTLASIPLGEDTVKGPFLPLEVSTQFLGLVPEYATGSFGSQVFELDENAEAIDWFRNLPRGTIDLHPIEMDLGIRNGVGSEFEVDFDYIIAINSVTDERTELVHPIIGGEELIFIDRAGDIPGTDPTIFYSNWETRFDSTNSNIDQWVETLPDILRYRINFHINPLGNTSLGNDFIYRQAGIEVYLDASMPLELSASNLLLTDTAEFSFNANDNGELDDVNGGVLRLLVDNYFPFEAGVQLYLLDENHQLLDSLAAPGSLVEAGIVQPSGQVESPAASILEFPVDQAKIDVLSKAAFLQIDAELTTLPTNQMVTIKSHYRMDLRVVADLNYAIN